MSRQQYRDERRAFRLFWREAAHAHLKELGQILCSHAEEQRPRCFSLDYFCYACKQEWHVALPEYSQVPFQTVLEYEMRYFERAMIQRCPHAADFLTRVRGEA